jgi:THO complex subunit 5
MAIDKTVTEPGLADVLNISAQSRDQATTLVRLLQEAAAEPNPAGPDSERAIELDKHEKLLFTNIAQLRGLHRAACFSARETKATTAEARQEVDRLHLQLQNLYYEQRHLQGEIEACESYKLV